MERVLALILAGGASERLSILCSERSKPAMPFGGKYRVIDFALSNCTNSGIRNVVVLAQFNPRSLAQHIGVGRPWDLDRNTGGLIILQPYLSRSSRDWYKGTADAVYQNLYYVEEQKADEVLILAGDHIYTMRYDLMINAHRTRKADVTVGVTEMPLAEASRFGVITLDHNERVIAFEEKPKEPKSNLVSMGIYIFKKKALIECLEMDAENKKSGHDFGRDILPPIIGTLTLQVFGYRFRGYWRDVGTIQAYWQANMELVADLPELNLYNPETEVRTQFQNMPPVKLGPKAQVSRSLIANGAIINGQVQNSVISPGVYIEEGVQVKDSVIFEGTTVSKGAIVNCTIIDKLVWVGAGCHIGYGDDMTPNREEPENLNTGITLVGKGAKIPDGVKVGHNCKIDCWTEKNDFTSDSIPSGASVRKRTPRRHVI